MRVLLYSDLQLHPYKQFSNLVAGVNDRLRDHFEVLDQIYAYAIANQIGRIVFGGDMFEVRTRVDVVAAEMLADWKHKVAKAGIEQLDLIGNHDLCDKSTSHNSIDLYRYVAGQKIFSKPQWFNIYGNSNILFVPYMHRLEDMKNGINLPPPANHDADTSLAVVHYGLYDVPTETHHIIRDQGYETEGQMRLSDLEELSKKVRFVFFGHFHITSAITSKIHFIGTPLQHNWGERGVETRFLDIDLDNGSFKSIYTKAPRFVEWQNQDDVDVAAIAGNFCRIKTEDLSKREELRQLLLQYKPRGAEVVITRKKTEEKSRLGLDLSMSFEQMGERMINAEETHLDKNRIRKVMLEALKEASKLTG
jgi:DNA repair exonuclease SbcCD nuclease subunit